jgi:uncharacterized membrane protein YphA (DoxX/SURF4 family)
VTTYAALAPRAEEWLRICYGVVLLAQLLSVFPHAGRYYASQRFGGYMDATPTHDRLHTPARARAILALWTACALCILFDKALLFAAACNVFFAWYFFVRTRGRSILRGMGAPGHIAYRLAALVFLLALSERCDVRGLLHASTVAVFRFDFACIMIVAGCSKIAGGYARNDGFQIGLVNPWWGRDTAAAATLAADCALYRAANHAAYGTEILAGLALLVPASAPYAAALFAATFLVVGRLIRLNGLAEMVATYCLLYVWPAHPVPAIADAPQEMLPLILALSGFLWIYAASLPLAYAGMALNLYGRRTFPAPLQRALDAWTRFFGLTLWRVFTNDIVNFYCDIRTERDGTQTLLPYPAHVADAITLASIFTTLKYHPHDRALFERRILAYARSLALASGTIVAFRYMSIRRENGFLRSRPVADFRVDPANARVEEIPLDPSFDPRLAATTSRLRSCAKPGTYA